MFNSQFISTFLQLPVCFSPLIFLSLSVFQSSCLHDLLYPLSFNFNSCLTTLPPKLIYAVAITRQQPFLAVAGEIKPHHKDSIVSSPENNHKWDKYCCLFSWPPQGLAFAWACDWSSTDLMEVADRHCITESGFGCVLITKKIKGRTGIIRTMMSKYINVWVSHGEFMKWNYWNNTVTI